jgi:hypothetical protein
MEHDENLQIISEILQEFSVMKTSFGVVYFKHISQKDQREIITSADVIKQDAKEKGLLCEDEAVEDLIDQEMWTYDQEKEIENLNKKIKSIKNSIGQINLPSKRKHAEAQMSVLQKKHDGINFEKQNLLGLTVEKFVSNKLQRLTVEKVLFYDKYFKESVYKNLYINDKKKEIEIYKIQTDFFKKFSDEKISRAVLSNYFAVYLPFCEDPLGVFGVPLKDLTSYQLKAISFGRYFLSIFKNSTKKIPDNIAKDPDLLISFYESSKNESSSGARSGKSGHGGTTHFGATKEDIEIIKQEDEDVVDLSEEMKKKGGSLNMKQMMELHGV